MESGNEVRQNRHAPSPSFLRLIMYRDAFALLMVTLFAWPIAEAVEPVGSKQELLIDLDRYVASLPREFNQLSVERAELLERFADEVADAIARDGMAKLNFICTHNSRRSHFSQVWAQVAAAHYGIAKDLQTFSGGTEATACNPRTISALARAGLKIDQPSEGTNPHYEIRYSPHAAPIKAFSKVYDDTASGNPASGFIAAMCCSRVDRECPLIQGAIARIPLHYDDPKIADNTPQESQTYDERCFQIAVEMFFVMDSVHQKRKVAP